MKYTTPSTIAELAERAGLEINSQGEIISSYFTPTDAGYRKFAAEVISTAVEEIRNYPITPMTTENMANHLETYFSRLLGLKKYEVSLKSDLGMIFITEVIAPTDDDAISVAIQKHMSADEYPHTYTLVQLVRLH